MEIVKMIKELKNHSHKISKKAILSCMVIAAVAISNCSMVKALDTNNSYQWGKHKWGT